MAAAHAQAVVEAAPLQAATWRTQSDLAAHLDARQNAVLAAPRGGTVTQVLFHSGEKEKFGAEES